MIKVAVCGAMGKMGASVLRLLGEDGDAEALCGIDALAAGADGKRGGGECVGGNGVDGNGVGGNGVDGERGGVIIYRSFAEMERDGKGKPDVIIDFSSPHALDGELDYAVKTGVPAVIGTTGFTPEQLKQIERASRKVAIFRTANFSLGVSLLCELVRRTAEVLGSKFDIEIIERHHNKKVDAPSGTAKLLAECVNGAFDCAMPTVCGREGFTGKRGREIGVHAVRGGTVVGEHEVCFFGEDETVTLSHSASSKSVFAAGAIAAAKWLVRRPAGMYGMKNLLNV